MSVDVSRDPELDFLIRPILNLVLRALSTQTYPLRPIDEWGKIKPEIYDISSTDGPREDWVKVVETTEPSVVVAIDVDV